MNQNALADTQNIFIVTKINYVAIFSDFKSCVLIAL